MASNGYLMVHCLNCGSYHCSSEPFDLGLAEFGEKVAGWVKSAGKNLVRKLGGARKAEVDDGT